MSEKDAIEYMLADLQEKRESLARLTVRREQERRMVIPDDILEELDKVANKFDQAISRSNSEIFELEERIKLAILEFGNTVKIGNLSAVYNRGRVSWDTAGLERYALQHPEVSNFCKVGKPYVSIR